MFFAAVSLLFTGALVITLVGFMEALSIARAMAVRTRQRIDPDQELIGQGLANIAGSFTQSFPVSGSFSRSAVNLDAGAMPPKPTHPFFWAPYLVVDTGSEPPDEAAEANLGPVDKVIPK